MLGRGAAGLVPRADGQAPGPRQRARCQRVQGVAAGGHPFPEPRGDALLAELWLQVWNHLLSAWGGRGDWRRCLSLEKQKEGRGWCPGVLRPSQGHVGPLPPKGVPLSLHTDPPVPARGEHSGSYRTASCGATGSSGSPSPACPHSQTCGRTDLSLTSAHHQGVLPSSSSALQLPNTPYFHGDASRSVPPLSLSVCASQGAAWQPGRKSV